MKLHYRCKLLPLLFFTLLLYASQTAQAQTITENQPLRFGTIMLTDNNAPRQIQLLSNGNYNADPQIVFFTDPQLGNFTVTGYPPLKILNVTINLVDLTNGGTPVFSLSNSFTNPALIVTNLSGSATFDVGATLSSDGSGSGFTDGSYDGVYSITVN